MPVAELDWTIPENFHIAWTDETGELGIEVTPACSGVEVGGVAILAVPHSLEGWPDFERNSPGCAVWRQYSRPDVTVGVLTGPLKGYGYSSRLVYSTV